MRISSLIVTAALLALPQAAFAGSKHSNCNCAPATFVTPNGMTMQRAGSVTIYRGSNPTPDFAAIAARKAEKARIERAEQQADEARRQTRATEARLERIEAEQARLREDQRAERRENINTRLYGYGRSYRGNNRFFGRNGFIGNRNFSGGSAVISRGRGRGGRKKN